MRYTVITFVKEGSVYNNTSPYTYNFNPEYNKLTAITGNPNSWMLDLIKQKDGVYLLSSARWILRYDQYLLIPESHPLFSAVCILRFNLDKIDSFLKSTSEGIVKELFNN